MDRTLITLLAFVMTVLAGASTAGQTAPYPTPKNLGDASTLGLGIQRTMTLLATSTPAEPPK